MWHPAHCENSVNICKNERLQEFKVPDASTNTVEYCDCFHYAGLTVVYPSINAYIQGNVFSIFIR